jgi:methylated-DNA-[protein]-cysteine S-methyltransferase
VSHHFALFDTGIGRCSIAWTGLSLISTVQLPEATKAATRARILRSGPGAKETPPPVEVQPVIDGIVALLDGEPRDLTFVVLDMADVPAFDRRVYEIARTIPPGATLSYGDVAGRLGGSGLARAVGRALGRNPFAIVVPCHRILAAHGRIGGFSASGGAATKRRLLAIEGAQPLLRS